MIYENIEEKKKISSSWFENLRNTICAKFEEIEKTFGNGATFKRSAWERGENEGGGVMSVMNGEVFEKVGVNISTVYGKFSNEFKSKITGAGENPEFWASGISLVAHMKSPFVPAIHMNTRMIVTTKSWFGGGSDLTPTFPYQEDTEHFHSSLKKACDKFSHNYYPMYKEECDKYFFLPHRNEARGIGGIFFDNFNTGNWEHDFNFVKEVGSTFLESFIPIVEKRVNSAWTQEDKKKQLIKRGRYVEFNLLYDRGTEFGLKTKGNTEAILMSMPPEVIWECAV